MIAGLQKMTLLDYPGKVACTVFLQGCNFRCPFCHNSPLLSGAADGEISREELLSFLKKRQGLLEGVCITGGEPTLYKELPGLLRAIKDLGLAVKLDTNGSRPEVVKALAAEKLIDYVAMDIKNCPQKYAQTVGNPQVDLAAIEKTMAFLMNGDLEFEFRTTVVQELHENREFEEMGLWFQKISPDKKIKNFYVQNYTDRDSVLCGGLHSHENAKLQDFLQIISKYVHAAKIRGVDL